LTGNSKYLDITHAIGDGIEKSEENNREKERERKRSKEKKHVTTV
jgi:hypothetical protein